MKSVLLISLIVALAPGTASILSAKNSSSAVPSAFVTGELPIDQVPAITAANGDLVTHGTSRIMVSLRLGQPSIVLSDGSWLYRDYKLDEINAKPGALVVRFVNNRVSGLSIATDAAVLALREPVRHPSKNQFLAATQKR